MKTRTETVVDVSEWDKLVQDTYKRPYDFQQQDDCRDRGNFYLMVPNSETYDYENNEVVEKVNGPERGVSFKAWLERDPKKPIPNQRYDWELNLWWARNFYPDIQMVANDLHAKGLLKAGQYTINIDW